MTSTKQNTSGESEDAVRVAGPVPTQELAPEPSDQSDQKRLIDDSIRDVAALIARIATVGGVRFPLAHVPDLLFHHIARELDEQGLSRKVIADMFGLALRSFQYRVKRSEPNATERDPSLWEAVLDFVSERTSVSRADVFNRFGNHDDRILRSVLRDLVDSAAMSATTSGPTTVYSLGAKAPATVNNCTASSSTDNNQLPAGVDEHFRACVGALLTAIEQGDCRGARANDCGFNTYTFEIWPGHPSEGRVIELFEDFQKALSCIGVDVQDPGESQPPPSDKQVKVTFYMGQRAERSPDQSRSDDPPSN